MIIVRIFIVITIVEVVVVVVVMIITVGGLDFGREPKGSSPKSRPPITIIAIINLFVVVMIMKNCYNNNMFKK